MTGAFLFDHSKVAKLYKSRIRREYGIEENQKRVIRFVRAKKEIISIACEGKRELLRIFLK